MPATRVRSQAKSSPGTASAASTPKAGRRLTPASATPTKRQKSVKTAPKAKAGTKGRPTGKVKKEEEAESDEPPTPSENTSSSDDDSEDAFDPPSSGSDEELVEEDEEESEVDSDFLDEEEDETRKRKAARGPQKPVKRAKPSNGKGKQAVEVDDDDDDDEDAEASEVELEEGQVIAGRIYPAPTTGQGMLAAISSANAEIGSPARSYIP